MPIQILKWIILCKYSNSENSLISQTEGSRKKGFDILDRWINRQKGIKHFRSQEAWLSVLTVYVYVGDKFNHICLYIYMVHALVYACMCYILVGMPVWLCMCMFVCKCLCDYLDMWYVCVCVHVFVCSSWLCVFMLGSMFIHMHVFVCVFLHL